MYRKIVYQTTCIPDYKSGINIPENPGILVYKVYALLIGQKYTLF